MILVKKMRLQTIGPLDLSGAPKIISYSMYLDMALVAFYPPRIDWPNLKWWTNFTCTLANPIHRGESTPPHMLLERDTVSPKQPFLAAIFEADDSEETITDSLGTLSHMPDILFFGADWLG